MQMGGTRRPDPADHVLEVQRNPVRVGDGHIQNPFDAVTNFSFHDQFGIGVALVEVVVWELKDYVMSE